MLLHTTRRKNRESAVAGTCLRRSCSFPELFVLVVLGAGERFRCVPFFLCGSAALEWPAVRLFRLCATQQPGTRPLEDGCPGSTKPTNNSRQLSVKRYSILLALHAARRLGYLVSYRSDICCECCLAWPGFDLGSDLQMLDAVRVRCGAMRAHSKLPLLQLPLDTRSTSSWSKQYQPGRKCCTISTGLLRG